MTVITYSQEALRVLRDGRPGGVGQQREGSGQGEKGERTQTVHAQTREAFISVAREASPRRRMTGGSTFKL